MVMSNPQPEVAEPSIGDIDETEEGITLLENLLRDPSRLDRQNRRLTFQERAQPRMLTTTYEEGKANEMLRQNIEQIETLLERRAIPNSLPEKAFNLENPKFKLGQWVDVVDTMGQWLEAQVTKLRADRVCVHFNGWGSRWDEWLETNSPRIAQFRTHTIQSPQSTFLSPYPSLEPDAQDHEIPEIQTTHEDLIKRYLECSEQTRDMMIQYLKKSTSLPAKSKLVELLEEQKEFKEELKGNTLPHTTITTAKQDKDELEHEMRIISGQLAPLLDRMGRILSDFSPHFSLLASDERQVNDQGAISFTRFPTASTEHLVAEQSTEHFSLEIAPRSEPMIPLMPNPAEISSLMGLTESSLRQNGPNLHRIIITVTNTENQAANNNSTRSELGTQT